MLRPRFGNLNLAVRAQRGAFDELASRATRKGTAKSIIICTNPRSGSWLLSEGLAATGVAGHPREWFNPFYQQRCRALWRIRFQSDMNFAQYLQLVRHGSRSLNGISGIKLHAYQLCYLQQFSGNGAAAEHLSRAQSLRQVFPGARYIWLTRRDRARQAISLELAFATSRWWSVDSQLRCGAPEKEMGPFDPVSIARWEAALTAYDARWAEYFKVNAITPLRLVYEDLVADYEGAIRLILRLLDLPEAETVRIPPPRLQCQSDVRNENWLAQYQAFRASGAAAALRFPSIDVEDPIEARCRELRFAIPPVWRRWIAQARLQHVTDDALIAVLIKNGYNSRAAQAAVVAVSSAAAGARLDTHAEACTNSKTEKEDPQP